MTSASAPHFPFNEKHHFLHQNNDINTDGGAEARSFFGIIRLYDDDLVEDRDNTVSIMREMVEHYHSKSDNIDTQRLHIKVNLRVVSTVCPLDRTVTQLLHNKPNIDELVANIALARWISSTSPHASCKALQRAVHQA